MYVQQPAPAAFPLSFRLQMVRAALAQIAKFIRAELADRHNAELAPHFQYDVGEIDYDPDRIRSLDNRNSYKSQLWLHHYPR
jgi:hypothetical protein